MSSSPPPGRKAPGASACDAVLAWVAGLGLAPGESRTLPVPAELSSAAEGHPTVQAIRGTDGALFALLKRPTGWKENFEGVLCCERDQPEGVVIQGGDRPYLSILSHPALEELYLRGQEGPRRFRVFFDLQ